MTQNALAQETSPYLLQHKDNPVHWQPWGPAALAEAKTRNKPILLSIGYAACHWCHVMAHESFEDPAIAGLMNDLFVSIKVDREERPDLDTIYQHALHLMGEHGGWPLTMFLTPAGEPFWGGTYFPPTSRWGRPGFPDVLRAISDAYEKQPEKVAKNIAAMKDALSRLSEPERGEAIDIETTDRIAERLLREIDMVNGGIGNAPKFPQVGILELLWRASKRSGNESFRNAVTLTLDHISQGGIYDHLGGGYSRYAVDARWLVPHFEKMLYDNALLIELLATVWQETRAPLLAQRIAETVAWLEREMLSGDGGFFSSLDADSEHEEGKFYVWSTAEIEALLGPRAERFMRVYDVSAEGNWEGKNILNRLHALAPHSDEDEQALAADRAVLLEARAVRVRPGLDDKVLADWNGLAIAALARAATVFERRDWLALATRAFAFVLRAFRTEGGRLFHSWRDGRARNAGILDDYANLSRAGLALHAATGDASYLAQAEAWVELLDRQFWDAAAGGYFFTAADAEALIARTKMATDQPNPSGNGTLVGVLAELYYRTGEERYRERAEGTVAAFSGELRRNVFGYSALLNGNELLKHALQVVVVGLGDAPDTAAMLQAIRRHSLPNQVLSVIAPDAKLPDAHPAAGKPQVQGRATVYVCEGPVCSLPFTDPAALERDLAQRR